MRSDPSPVTRLLRYLDGRRRRVALRLRSLPIEPEAWLADRKNRSRYERLDESQLRHLVRSETCFVFGCGRSLVDISPAEWQAISRHNTIGFNYFIRSGFVPVDFHLVGEMASYNDRDPAIWRPVVQEYAKLIEENPCYSKTVLGLQEGLSALQSNRLAASAALRPERRVFRYRRIARGAVRPPSTSLATGLVHGAGSLVGCVNLAVILGFREVVLAGVDLYDRRVFWASDNAGALDAESLGAPDGEERHATADAMVEYLGDWGPRLAARGVTLSVYNPRSLLSRVLPVKGRLG